MVYQLVSVEPSWFQGITISISQHCWHFYLQWLWLLSPVLLKLVRSQYYHLVLIVEIPFLTSIIITCRLALTIEFSLIPGCSMLTNQWLPVLRDDSPVLVTSSHRVRGALDRFCQFFRTPLFTESATEREINAVDSEHSMNLQADSRRSYAAA